jgi:hypothetical protein
MEKQWRSTSPRAMVDLFWNIVSSSRTRAVRAGGVGEGGAGGARSWRASFVRGAVDWRGVRELEGRGV